MTDGSVRLRLTDRVTAQHHWALALFGAIYLGFKVGPLIIFSVNILTLKIRDCTQDVFSHKYIKICICVCVLYRVRNSVEMLII